MALFRAYRAVDTTVSTYFIESTAPNNVDDNRAPPFRHPRLEVLNANKAIRQIARRLADADTPNLVFMVHGFSNPQSVVLPVYAAASAAIERDSKIRGRDGLVCVGYRWPSEHILEPWRGTWDALPLLPTWLLWIGAAAIIALTFSMFFGESATWWQWVGHFAVVFAWILPGIVLTATLLRLAAYFRDNYRAQTYGAPDLIEIIRKIDAAIVRHDKKRGRASRTGEARVQLSFIGHSMGALVVTTTIRVLSDLFSGDAVQRRPQLNSGVVKDSTEEGDEMEEGLAEEEPEDDDSEEVGEESREPERGEGERPRADSHIGHVFRLMRFVLASPDIPAEALLSNRANFLQASLLRFDEAFLFSNEGDEVLRQISTIANYFSFPTKNRKHGFRLGNVEILSQGYGVITWSPNDFLGKLRIGYCTLQELYERLKKAHWGATQDVLPKVFTYFDCTDYRDRKYLADQGDWGPEQSLLTYARRTKRKNPSKGLNALQHMVLLVSYPKYRNCHGGYFQGDLSQELIYRLACLGYEATERSYGGIRGLSARCEEKQIRVIVSPELTPLGLDDEEAEILPPPPPCPTASGEIKFVVPEVVGIHFFDALKQIYRPTHLQIGDTIVPVTAPSSAKRQERAVRIVGEKSPKPPCTVLRQTPPPGEYVTRKTEIILTVASEISFSGRLVAFEPEDPEKK